MSEPTLDAPVNDSLPVTDVAPAPEPHLEPVAPVVPVEPAVTLTPEALKVARSYLHYADAILLSVDEPVEGGRERTAAQLLLNTIETVTANPSAMPRFWQARCDEAQVHPTLFSKLFTREHREALTRDEVRQVRRVVWAAVETVSAPEVVRQTRRFMLVGKVALAVLISIVLGVVAVRLVQRMGGGTHLLQGKPFRTSTTLPGFVGEDGSGKDLLFHTQSENSPWVEFDLGQPTLMKEVFIINRQDCCDERALPLVIEVGDDQKSWRQVAERKMPFKKVTIPFEAVTARYLRLRVLRPTFLHLEGVEAR